MGRDRRAGGDQLPAFLQAAAHPIRWRLLGELARSDRQVHELTALLGERQNLVSYHLGRLREAALVRTRRSAADGRDVYYRLDLARCGQLLTATGAALHPGLRYEPPPVPSPPPRARVLFLCTGNSSRSQMAEALLRRRSGGAVAAYSAGSRPKPIHPHAVAAMAERGIDLGAARPKHLDEFAGQHFDRAITLCDRLREACPEPAAATVSAHWSVPDPAADPAGRDAFGRVADDLAERVGFLLHTLAGGTTSEAS